MVAVMAGLGFPGAEALSLSFSSVSHVVFWEVWSVVVSVLRSGPGVCLYLRILEGEGADLQQDVRTVVNCHHQSSNTDVIGNPREAEQGQRGCVMDHLFFKVLQTSLSSESYQDTLVVVVFFTLKSSADSPSASRQKTGWGAEKRRSPSPGCSTSTETAAWTAWTRDNDGTGGRTLNPTWEKYLLVLGIPPTSPSGHTAKVSTGKSSKTSHQVKLIVHLSGQPERQMMLRETEMVPCSEEPNDTHNMEAAGRRAKQRIGNQPGKGGWTAENLTPATNLLQRQTNWQSYLHRTELRRRRWTQTNKTYISSCWQTRTAVSLI